MTHLETKSEKVDSSSDQVGPKPFAARMSAEQINNLPRRHYLGDVVLVQDDDAMLEVLPLLSKEPVLGFDTETRPAFRKGQVFHPSLLQLGGTDTVYLFQLQMLTQLDELFAVLEKPDVLKVGVAMGYDIRKLQEMCTFEPHGFVDLEALTDSVGIEHNGLRKLTAIVLGFRISKGAQRSNWAKKELTQKQITYAATDAWVSRAMYVALLDAGAAISTSPAEL